MLKRRNLSEIIGRPSALRTNGDTLEIYQKGKLVAVVNLDDLFDKHGNRFNRD